MRRHQTITTVGRVARIADRALRMLLAALMIVLPLHAQPALAQIVNTATATVQVPNLGQLTSDPATSTLPLVPPLPSMVVTKVAELTDNDASGGVSAGDTITYEIVAQNTGNVSIGSVELVDVVMQAATPLVLDAAPSLQAGDTDGNNTLGLDETWVWTASYTLSQEVIDSGADIENTASVRGIGGGVTVSGTAQVATPVIGLASLLVAKTAVESGYSTPGETVSWTITTTNTGDLTLTALTISDPGASAIVCQSTGDATVAALAPDTSEVCLATSTVTDDHLASGVIENTVTVTGLRPDGNEVVSAATATLPVVPADLVTVKTLASANAVPSAGDTVSFLITVTNNGPADGTNIALVDLMPFGLTPVPASTIASAGAYDSDTGRWSIGNLAVGQSAQLQISGTVDPAAVGLIVNTTTAASGAQLDPSSAGDILTATIAVSALEISARDDVVPNPLDPAQVHANVVNVLDGDTVSGVPATSAMVTVSAIGTWPDGIVLGADGMISLEAGVAPAIHALPYQICQLGNPSNCDEAIVTVTIAEPLATLSGVIFFDTDLDGVYDPLGDVGQAGYIITLRQDGQPVDDRETISGAGGVYAFDALAAGTYSVTFSEPSTGVVVGSIRDIIVGRGDVVVDQNLPIDPSGVIYDAVTGDPVPGAVVTLVDGSGTPLPDACLFAGQQGQVTGADGFYRFDLVPGSAPQCPLTESVYSIAIAQPSGYGPAPSGLIPPTPGPMDVTACPLDVSAGPTCALSNSDTPSVTTPSPYLFAFLLAPGDPHVVMNHIPLDPLQTPTTATTTIAKAALVSIVRRGEAAPWRITISHSETTPVGPVDVIDTLPNGFSFVAGSLRLNGSSIDGDVSGRQVAVRGLVINAGETIEITLLTRAGAGVLPGDHVNRVQLAEPGTGAQVGAVAEARVRIEAEPVFDCGDVIGTVFEDLNRDGYRDDGEPGIPGVRLATVRGTLITTDQYGRYSLPCAELPDADIGSNTLIKLDERSLPTGLSLTTENPRVMRLTAGKISRLDFGVASRPVLTINLQDEAFVPGEDSPSAALSASVRQWVELMIERGATVQFVYSARAGEQELARRRLSMLTDRLSQAWSEAGRRDRPEVDIRIIGR